VRIAKQACTLEFKALAVKRVKDGQVRAGVARNWLRSWIKAPAAGKM